MTASNSRNEMTHHVSCTQSRETPDLAVRMDSQARAHALDCSGSPRQNQPVRPPRQMTRLYASRIARPDQATDDIPPPVAQCPQNFPPTVYPSGCNYFKSVQ